MADRATRELAALKLEIQHDRDLRTAYFRGVGHGANAGMEAVVRLVPDRYSLANMPPPRDEFLRRVVRVLVRNHPKLWKDEAELFRWDVTEQSDGQLVFTSDSPEGTYRKFEPRDLYK